MEDTIYLNLLVATTHRCPLYDTMCVKPRDIRAIIGNTGGHSRAFPRHKPLLYLNRQDTSHRDHPIDSGRVTGCGGS